MVVRVQAKSEEGRKQAPFLLKLVSIHSVISLSTQDICFLPNHGDELGDWRLRENGSVFCQLPPTHEGVLDRRKSLVCNSSPSIHSLKLS